MAQIVCIAAGTYRPGLSELGDVVCVRDEHIPARPGMHDGFEVVPVDGMTAAEVRTILESKIPEVEDDNLTAVGAEKWFDVTAGEWKKLAKRPMYYATIVGISKPDRDKLKDKLVTVKDKEIILQDGAQDKVALDTGNQAPVLTVVP